jgi:hypothetical protein
VSDVPESDAAFGELAYGSAAARLALTGLIGGAVLAISPLLPFEVVDGQAQFVWSVLGDLPIAAQIAALSSLLLGIAILLGARFVQRPSLFALHTLASLFMLSVMEKLGSDAAAWDVRALPDSLNHRVEFATLTLALSAAALRLLAEPVAARAARAMALAALLAGLLFSFLPGRSEAPIVTLVRFLSALPSVPDFRLVLGYGLLLLIVLFPLLGATIAVSAALGGMRRHAALVSELVLGGLPALFLLLAARNVLLTFGDVSVVVLAGAAFVLYSLLALTARSLELLSLYALGLGRSDERERGRPARFVALLGAACVFVTAAMVALSRPATKGVSWKLASASPAADALFGELLPKWVKNRALWGRYAGKVASAAELAETRAAGNDVLKAARALDPELGRAVTALVTGSSELDVAGRRWFRLLEGVNEASRRRNLPYYLDPTILSVRRGGRSERLLLLHPYRIERVDGARFDDTDYALLSVRRLGEARARHRFLGFSRDVQPFALVVLDEVEPYAASLRALAAADPPSCVEGSAPAVFARCGKLLRELGPSESAIRKLVERHELEHQIDGARFPIASVVQSSGIHPDFVDEVNRELSAYLAEFDTPGVSPKLALVHLLPFAFRHPKDPLHHVGHSVFAALSGEEPASAERSEGAVARRFDALAALPDDELRRRCRDAYEEIFDSALPDVVMSSR